MTTKTLQKRIIFSILGIILTLQIISIFVMMKILGVFLILNNVQYSVKRILIMHIMSSVGGMIVILLILRTKTRNIDRFVTLGILFSILLLVFLPFAGTKVNNATRWIRIGGISLQPSCAFLAFYPYLNGTLLSQNKNKKSFLVFVIAFLLIIMQPDFGSTLLLTGVWGSQVFFADKIQLFWKEILLTIGTFTFTLLIKGSYAIKRILSIFGTSKKFDQSFLALKAIKYSKFWMQNSNMYIPEMHNDYFFTALCHNYGIIMAIFVLTIWCYLLIIMLNGMKITQDRQGKEILLGYIILLAGQSFLHLFTNLHLIPCKGISFPFLSAGGSLIIGNAVSFGIFLAILSNRIPSTSYYNSSSSFSQSSKKLI